MNSFDEVLKNMAQEEDIQVPDSVKEKIEMALEKLPEKNENISGNSRIYTFRRTSRFVSAAACILFAALFVLPNASVSYAKTMEQVPVIGNLVKVVTIRNYFYEDEKHEMDIRVPEVQDEANPASVEEINQDVETLTAQLVDQFREELKASGNEGYSSIEVDHETVTNTDCWFTLRLSVHEIAADSNTSFRYYHINKKTGKTVKLEELFQKEDYIDIFTKEIVRQMQEQMGKDSNKIYWINDSEIGDISYVTGDHNFYFNEKGDLVIPYDKFEVAPGYMGCPEFTISKKMVKPLLKDEYKDILS